MKDDGFVGVILGITFGFIIVSVATLFSDSSYYNVVKNAKTECEKSLPRDQKCVIIAIPKDKK